MALEADPIARDIALRRWVLPECLHVPIAAIDVAAITRHVGRVAAILSYGSPDKAFLVETEEPPPRDDRLPIWDMAESAVFHEQRQVWVHVGYTRYRKAYRRAFPHVDVSGKVLSHAMNRRVAMLKGFQFVRITPVARSSNSSSAFSEGWAVARHATLDPTSRNKTSSASIQYADLSDLLLMMDLKVGGGVMGLVNEGQKLVTPR